ncbi:MAG: bifunctional 2-C-methyl-D-erythritol 4-phosphate cytidylyltransferase/2-C-methyl-D-erythritol 2,4-cyclodiphosphate synthase [Rhizobiaceae bacterium]
MHKSIAIIVAAGRGQRMASASDGPKQYRKLGSLTVLDRSISGFVKHDLVDLVLPVIHPDDASLFESLVTPHRKLLPPVFGATSRQESVNNGLKALVELSPELVLIHDGVRPFVDQSTITEVINAIEPGVCCLPVNPVTDTLKHIDDAGFVDATVDRSSLVGAQTPQGFTYKEILAAHQAAAAQDAEFTDDAQIAEFSGLKIKTVQSPATNFKITTQEDLETARMRYNSPDIRTGNGYDVHRLDSGDFVTLCGIEIPHTKSLDGHSDADVGLHALTDALLGTIANGDIGSHFPPSEPEWKDASSDRFLRYAVDLVQESGGIITHLDVTLICEQPKIGPHRDVMRRRISEICRIEITRVSVKATTNERIGFIGRQEGIAAIATATVSFGPQELEQADGN